MKAQPESELRQDTGGDTLEMDLGTVPRGSWLIEVGSSACERSVVLSPGNCITLGSGRSVSLRVDDRTVSATHCRVSSESAGLVVRDLGSKNGLFVGGARVAEAVLSLPGTVFAIGRTSVVVRRCEGALPKTRPVQVPGLVGSSPAMRRVMREIHEVARCRAPILIQGESGTGKDVVARALHELSGRRGAYVPINAGAFPDALADSELFGHCRGAFTGAVAYRSGAFEQADAGTLFLDEVAELSPAVQVRLLRVVEDGRVRPLGGIKDTVRDVRVVSASWASLVDCIQRGRFRADLYHRLSTITIQLPPLRERKGDIPELCQALLARFESEFGRKAVGPAALARLCDYSFPGNVRELGSVLYRAGLRAESQEIEPHHLCFEPLSGKPSRPPTLSASEARQLYEQHKRNISAAARAARVPRSTFRGWLER